ncbi:MAG: GFA family protein [Rhodobacteraceae bacterium]|nr:GFA family protein [Paracoccaceae bacterium]
MHKGSCMCGAISFEVEGDLPGPDACHCTNCRKSSGHYAAGTDVKKAALSVTGAENVTWYASSKKVNRGFCKTCGSALFFDPPHLDWIGISMGAFDTPTQTKLAIHIFVADKGDYYDITDGLPQNQQ